MAEARGARHSAMILDANTGAILHNDDGDEQRHPASLTKMMTLYLTFETLDQGRMSMSSMVSISENAASVAPSKLDLDPGEEISVRDAILALITKSANDVSVALAEKIGGSEANFVRLMNAKAGELGMSKTRFYNPNGLPHPAQVTTARDMITLGLHLQDDFPQYYQLFATRSFSYHGRSHRNHNTLMNNFAGIDGIKTGYTRASGFNLVTSVRRGGRHVVGAVFGGASAATRNGEMRMLLTRALNRASTTKTRKPAPALIAKLKGEPKRAERPPPKVTAPKQQWVALPPPEPAVAKTKLAEARPRPVAEAEPAAKSEPAPLQATKAEKAVPPETPAASQPMAVAAAEPAAEAVTHAERDAEAPAANALESAAVPSATAGAAPVEVTKVRRVMVAPRQGPKRPPVNLAETTDMASSDDGSDDNAPEVSETIVPKTDAPARPMFAALPDTKASMLGAADVTPTAERPEAAAADNTRAAAAAQADSPPVVTPAVAPGVAAPAPAVKPAVNSPQPAAKAATSTIVSAPRPAAAKAVPRTKVITASLTAPPAPAAAATSRTAAPAARAVEKAAAPIQRGTPPSSLAAQAAALKSPQRVAALAPAPFATGTPPPPGRFEIQIGAYASVAEAQKALNAVQARAGTVLASHPSVTQPINKDGRQVFRARFRGFDANSAANACGKLRQQSFDCFVMTAE